VSTLGDIEIALVARLATASLGGEPVFATVRGATGVWRLTLREALMRERMPAAFVAFIDEPTAPETPAAKLGARFAVLAAARSLRTTSDPRHGDDEALGAFELIDQVRGRLNGWTVAEGLTAQGLGVRFIDADERFAVYELLYRIHPTQPEEAAPGAPQTLEAFTGPEIEDVRLAWESPPAAPDTGPAAVYKIYRKRAGESAFALIDGVPAAALEQTLASQPSGESLSFRVTAANMGGEGPPSNTVVVFL
jgi:hypothetical protein